MKAITCPQCGGLIQEINENKALTSCEYCGAKILVPFEKRSAPVKSQSFAPDAPSLAGYNELGYPIDEELPFATGAGGGGFAGKVAGFISALVIIISAVVIFGALASKSRSQASLATPTPYRTPTPAPTPNRSGVEKNIESRALSMPKPVLPKGTVIVSRIVVEVYIKVDAQGNVTQAQAYTGTEVLKKAAEQTAKTIKFKPNGKESAGILVYEFLPN